MGAPPSPAGLAGVNPTMTPRNSRVESSEGE